MAPRSVRRTDDPSRTEGEPQNLALWERIAERYEDRNAVSLRGERATAWGIWRVPERELGLLENTVGRDVLELGCGSAGWAIALARQGARPVGLDFSPKRLGQARARMRRAGVDFPLVRAAAERIPYPRSRFDVVLSDYGATTFADPSRVIPEVARVLRPGGIFVFAHASPFRTVAENRRTDRLGRRLAHDYFRTRVIRSPADRSVEYQLPYGEWVRLFVTNGFTIERLIEPMPGPRARSSYVGPSETRWARRWPLEVIWKLRKTRPSSRRSSP